MKIFFDDDGQPQARAAKRPTSFDFDVSYRQIVRSSLMAAERCGLPLNDVSRAGALLAAHPAVEDAIAACPVTDEDALSHLYRVLEEEVDMDAARASEFERADTEPAMLAMTGSR